MNGRHTCISDDGGTPSRKCWACEEEKQHSSAQPCGCDAGAKWICMEHRVEFFRTLKEGHARQ